MQLDGPNSTGLGKPPEPLRIAILGTRGIPHRHGGLEALATHLSTYLASRGHHVYVQCEELVTLEAGEQIPDNVHRIPVKKRGGAVGDVLYDRRAILRLRRQIDVAIMAGYAAAPFFGLLRRAGVPIILNPDGMEWQRPKFSRLVRLYLRATERIGVRSADTVVADSPWIRDYHERTHKANAIFAAYGGEQYDVTEQDLPLRSLVAPNEYFLVLGRLEPSCLTLEIIREYVACDRPEKLLVVGPADPKYLKKLKQAADDRVIFAGPLYGDRAGLFALRKFCLAYIDGHHTGGINPSTIEAMMAGRHIVAHDNVHIRAAVGDTGCSLYTREPGDLASILNQLPAPILTQSNPLLIDRAKAEFSWYDICATYEQAVIAAFTSNRRR